MPIPKTRAELTELVDTSWTKLRAELDAAGPEVAQLPCVDEWTVKDLLAVRLWWTEHVVEWIQAGPAWRGADDAGGRVPLEGDAAPECRYRRGFP